MYLLDKYKELSMNEAPKGCYLSLKISEDSENRIAINNTGQLNVLISTSKYDKNEFSPINLSNIQILPNTNCKIHENGLTLKNIFTIVCFKNNDAQLKEYFLKVIESVFIDLPKEPTIKDIFNTIFYLVEIFRYISETPRKSILGLWGELLFIETSKKPENLLSIWHDDIYEYLDFSSPKISFETKCTTNERRIHNFSNQQLILKNETFIVSIMTKSFSSGFNISDLVERITKKIDNQKLAEKLNLIVARTLGYDLLSSNERYFDYDLAKESMKIYSVLKIPKIKSNQIPSEIFDLRYKIDLTEIENVSIIF